MQYGLLCKLRLLSYGGVLTTVLRMLRLHCTNSSDYTDYTSTTMTTDYDNDYDDEDALFHCPATVPGYFGTALLKLAYSLEKQAAKSVLSPHDALSSLTQPQLRGSAASFF